MLSSLEALTSAPDSTPSYIYAQPLPVMLVPLDPHTNKKFPHKLYTEVKAFLPSQSIGLIRKAATFTWMNLIFICLPSYEPIIHVSCSFALLIKSAPT